MKIENVYIGFTIDGEEHIFYKTSVLIDNVKFKVYVDLETKQEYSSCDVDESSLIKASTCLKDLKSRMFRRKVLNIYNVDREELIDLRRAFYGDVVDRIIIKNSLDGERKWVEKPIREDVLFFQEDSNHGIEDLRTSKKYYDINERMLGVVAKKKRLVKLKTGYSGIKTKKKVLEMDYRKEL